MKFYKKVRRKVLILGSIMIACGLVFFGLGIILFFQPDLPPEALSSLSVEEVSSGNFVSLKNFEPIGDYVTENTDFGDYIYILIATKDKDDQIYYLTLRLKDDEKEILLQHYLDLPEGSWVTEKSYYGDLVILEKDAKDYLDSWLLEYPVNEKTPVLNLVLEGKPGTYQPDDTGNQVVGIIMALLGLGLIVYMVIELFGKRNKEVMETAKILSHNGDGVGYLERFDLDAEKISDAYANDEAILSNMNFRVKLIPYKDILWAYRLNFNAATKRMDPSAKEPRFFKILHSYLVVLRTQDKKRYTLALRSYDQAVDLIERIKRQNPNLTSISFDPKLDKAFKKDPLGFKAKADYILERLKQTQS